MHGCHVVGAVPGRCRDGEIAAGRLTLRGPADPPRSGVRAGARTATRVKFASRAAGRGRWAGRRAEPAQVSRGLSCPRDRAVCRVSQAAGGVLTGHRPSPAAAPGRAGRGRATRTTPPPEPRAGRCGRAAGSRLQCRAGRLGLRHRRSRGPGAADGRGRARADSHHGKVRDPVRLCFGNAYLPAGRVRKPRSRYSAV